MKFCAWGHPNVQATHRTTLEITTDDFLTRRGDCILAVKSELGLADLKDELEKKRGGRLSVVFAIDGEEEIVEGFVHPHLTFASPTTIILRKSEYLSERTAAIMCTKAARDLSREFVSKLRDPHQRLDVEFLF